MAKGKMPPMGGMNMNAMLRQAQKMQSDIEELRRELNSREYTHASGGGEVSVTVNGRYECLRIDISPAIIDPEDADGLSDLIALTINAALKAAREDSERSMEKISGGIGMGGLL